MLTNKLVIPAKAGIPLAPWDSRLRGNDNIADLMQCAFCEKQIEILDKVGRQDVCPNCQQDLHCCKQCRFYDPAAYNECHETQAERVLDKEKANFCDYFQFSGKQKESDNKKQNISKLENLFKKTE